MTAYGPLAAVYDRLTGDVGYERRADYIQRLFGKSRIPVHTVLDLACGTGTMTAILTERGYELIAVDASPDMLAQAREKAAEVPGEPPVFLNQDMRFTAIWASTGPQRPPVRSQAAANSSPRIPAKIP